MNVFIALKGSHFWFLFDTFDIFQDRFLQSKWSMDLFDPFSSYLIASYCIWQIEISYPISLHNIAIDLYLSEASVCPLYP